MSIPLVFVSLFFGGNFSLTSIIFVDNELIMDMTIMLFTYLTKVFPDYFEKLCLSIILVPV